MHIKDPRHESLDQLDNSERAVMLASNFNITKFELPRVIKPNPFIVDPYISALFMSLSYPEQHLYPFSPSMREHVGSCFQKPQGIARREPVLFYYNRSILGSTLQNHTQEPESASISNPANNSQSVSNNR